MQEELSEVSQKVTVKRLDLVALTSRIDNIAIKKPGLLIRKMNAATKLIFKEIEDVSSA